MRKVLLVALLSLAPIAHAGGQSVVIAVGYNPSAPTAHVQISADFVAIQINVQSDARDPLKRTDEIEKALRVVAERVKQDATLSIRPGVVSLSPTDQSKVSSFSSGYDAGSSAQLYVLGALKPDTSVFAVTKRIYQTITAIPLADGARVTFGRTALGMSEPEKYRGQILGLIAKSIADTKKAIGAVSAVEVSGLESPVSVMQLNESEVMLFIHYQLKLETKSAP